MYDHLAELKKWPRAQAATIGVDVKPHDLLTEVTTRQHCRNSLQAISRVDIYMKCFKCSNRKLIQMIFLGHQTKYEKVRQLSEFVVDHS